MDKDKKQDWRLPQEGFVRLDQILGPHGPLPFSKSTWWAGVASGKYPAPTKFFGPKIAVWDVAEIRRLLERARSANGLP